MAKSFDVLKHELVPRHEVLPAKEAKDLLAKYSARPEQLPRILETDPAARAVGAKAGQILKITRKSATAGEAIAFRVVVEA
jgi:DNA-directed RNA polymerase subunit H